MRSRVQSTYIFWKKCSILRKKTFFKYFRPNFIRYVLVNPCVISNKIPWSIQSSKQRRFTVLINIFSSIAGPLLPICMAEFCITEYSGFIFKKKHSLYQRLLVGDRSVSLHNGNLEFPDTEKCDDSKGLTTKIFANICI